MCIICASPEGVRQPTREELIRMFSRNPHGAGYMYARNGKVIIHKGFMDLYEFTDAVKSEHFTAKDSVVYHFRISTQAGINPEMTHPFPLSNRLEYMRKLDVRCGCGVAHNGIITLTSDPDEHRYSDTALFITRYLSHIARRRADLRDPGKLHTIQRLTGSKFALLDGSGYIATIGEFFNEDGLLFSNTSYLPDPFRSRK